MKLKGKTLRFILVFFIAGSIVGVALGLWLTRNIPEVDSLQFFTPHLMTRIYSRNGMILKEYGVEKRTLVRFSSISPNFIHALISVEDADFYHHHGISFRGIARALLSDLIHMRASEGGSTITQQLARQYFLTPAKTIKRKLKEMILAVNIESHYSKNQILEMYANKVCFGSAYYGVEASSQHYFGKPADELSIPESATLAGLIQRPSYYSPDLHPKRALKRRNIVLYRMLKTGYITRKQYLAFSKSPLGLYHGNEQGGGIGAYVTARVRMYLVRKYGEKALYTKGFRVNTTIDADLQQSAQKAVADGLDRYSARWGYRGASGNPGKHPEYKRRFFEVGGRYWATVQSVKRKEIVAAMGKTVVKLTSKNWALYKRINPMRVFHVKDRIILKARETNSEFSFDLVQPPLAQGALIAIDPHTGEILALVGGYDFSSSMFNRAIQARRQTGSAVKPIIYAAALENGRTLASQVIDSPTIFLTGREDAKKLCDKDVAYMPHDFDPEYFGLTTYRTALEHSINIDAVHVLNQTGYSKVIALAKRLHITTHLQPFPSMALGSFGISLIELTGAYTVFDNGGIWTHPHFISRIEDKDGKTLELFHSESEPVISPEIAYLMTQALVGVVKVGTASSAKDMKGHYAGKTGTTDNYTDSWFIGYSPSILCGVWAGKDDHTSLGNLQTGARVALPIWRSFMEVANLGKEDLNWVKPEDVEKVLIDPDTGLRAGVDSPCRRVTAEYFIKGTEPAAYCTERDEYRLKLPFFLQTYPLTPGLALVMPEADIDAWTARYPSIIAHPAPERLLVSWKGTTFPVKVKVAPPREGPVPQAVMPGLPHEGAVVCGARVEYINEKR